MRHRVCYPGAESQKQREGGNAPHRAGGWLTGATAVASSANGSRSPAVGASRSGTPKSTIARQAPFRLWFHPTNLADEVDQMLAGLRTIFAHAARLRERDALTVAPMGAIMEENASS